MRHRKGGRRIWLAAVAAGLFLAGLSVLLYPAWTNWRYNCDVRAQKSVFEGQVAAAAELQGEGGGMPFADLYRELQAQNERLYREHQQGLKDPFSYERPGIDLTEYGLEGNTIGFLSIPKMEIELPILLGANEENLRQGAAHLTETSYPIGGENTNCVLAAHRGYSRAAMFREIESLEPGDEVYIETLWGTLTYQVAEIRIIAPTDVQELLIQPGRDLVTLITCHPYRRNDQRYVVCCQRVEEG